MDKKLIENTNTIMIKAKDMTEQLNVRATLSSLDVMYIIFTFK